MQCLHQKKQFTVLEGGNSPVSVPDLVDSVLATVAKPGPMGFRGAACDMSLC